MINVFILAAGLGERLRPITNHTPKPLLPILGKPVLGIVLEKLSSLKPDNIGINLHYRGKDIERFLRDSPFIERITFFKEASLLGTGGALKNAESLLKRGTFLVHNSDILSEIDLNKALEFHKTSKAIASLIIHDHPEHNKLLIDETGILTGLGPLHRIPSRTDLSQKAFTGIAIYEPEFLDFIPEGFSSVTEAWIKAIKAGQRILTIDVTGTYWTDIGRPYAYAKAVFDALRKKGENIFAGGSDCSMVNTDGFVSIEGRCRFSEGVSLRNCIVIDRKILLSGEYENIIIGPDFEMRFDEKEVFDSDNGLILIGTGGSDRRYYRATADQMGLENGSKTVIFVKYPPEDHDFERHIEYTRFFKRHKIPVPELIRVDTNEKTAIFEDLGDTSLYNWLKCGRIGDQIEMMYRKILDIAISIHSRLIEDMSECPLLRERVFDYSYFRWETDYFIERFIKPFFEYVNIEISVFDELDRLAQRANSFPKTVIHRDFQSQNIMIKDNSPRIIDYQGARIGPPAYDIASILWDPYYRIDDAMRERLLEYYIMKMSKDPSFDPDGFLISLFPCRLQRHMQALGAYGFLSVVKGKRYFLKFVPEALRMLSEEITTLKGEYPSLFDLISSLTPR